MGQAIEQGGGQLGITEHLGPFAEVQVGRDHDAGVFVELAEQVEQQRAAGLRERQIAEFIEDDQLDSQETGGDAAGVALGLLLFQRVDQIHGRVKAHAFAVADDAGHTQGCSKVRFAGTGPAHEHDAVRRFGEGQIDQLLNQLAIHRRSAEVEAGQVAMDREARGVHLGLHRAQRPVGAAG